MKVTMLPLDNRPVTYLWPQLLAKCAGIEALAPPRAVLGSLDGIADIEAISNWLTQRFADLNTDYHLLCLDTALYGGLIPARRSTDTQAQIEQRLHNLLGKPDPSAKKERFGGRIKGDVFIQSSIMRISDNYDATEEKDYWRRYGREIFAWSEIMHRLSADDGIANGQLEQYEAKIPIEIRNDYLQTRRRNFAISRQLVELVPYQKIQKLVLSQDDSGTYGLNVLEKERLFKLAQSLKIQEQVICYAGADEVLETLLANALVQYGIRRGERRPKCVVRYSSPNGANQNSRYEGQKISDSVENQIRACGVALVQDNSEANDVDFIVVVHTSENVQGDHIVIPGAPDLSQVPSRQSAAQALQIIEASDKPVVICDVAYANGADPQLVEPLLARKDLVQKIWGYAGWNTAGNTIGSSLAMSVSRWFSTINEGAPAGKTPHTQAIFVRLLDDWAYQAVVRATLAGKADVNLLNELMEPHVKTVAEALDWRPANLQFTFPWNRTFEVEIVYS
jgi:hypothetical protein